MLLASDARLPVQWFSDHRKRKVGVGIFSYGKIEQKLRRSGDPRVYVEDMNLVSIWTIKQRVK